MTAPITGPVLFRVEDGVAHLTLNRPHARNAITVDLATALHDRLLDAAERARVVVVRGAGGHFCAGGDVEEVARLRRRGPEAMRPLFETFVGACELIAGLPVPVVAAVEGYAMAGGFELIQSVDVAVVREDAVLADNHANLGMIPGGGGSQRLPRLVGPQRALGHLLLGERISGATAAQWGLVHTAVPAERFESTVHEVVANLLGKDRSALARIKHLVRNGLRGPLADGLAAETEEIIVHLGEDRAGPRLARHGGRDTT
ncbi:MAG: enoyl-CoA hydratase/isomerase family protein [Actinomycetota bacterium]|nr:enoyl-CoA hydratase/isomerase family protein [Actinomycetota bacterium]